MPSKPEVSPLHKQLDSFGRRGRRLTAAKLKRYPGVLVALFGQEALADADAEQILAERVERAILAIIAGINDERDRRIAEAVFCAKPEFYDLNVDARQRKIKDMGGGDLRERYKTQRARIVSDVAAALQRMCGAQKVADHDALLSPEARRAARQLYRYAQQALVVVDAYDLCVEFAAGVGQYLRWARAGGCNLAKLPRGWLGAYCNDDENLRLVPATTTPEADSALWAYAYCHRYLRTLLQDPTGRDYLRENLPLECWRSVQLGAPFESDEVDKMLSVLAESQFDDAYTFADNLCQDSQGRIVEEKWRKLLTTGMLERENWGKGADTRLPSISDPSQLGFDLLMLCIALQHVFPEETLTTMDEDFRLAVGMIILLGLFELGVPDGHDERKRESKLVDDILKYRPLRYYLAEEGDAVWDNDHPKHDPWAEFH